MAVGVPSSDPPGRTRVMRNASAWQGKPSRWASHAPQNARRAARRRLSSPVRRQFDSASSRFSLVRGTSRGMTTTPSALEPF